MKPEITSEDRIPKEKNNFAQEIVQVACDPKQFPLFWQEQGIDLNSQTQQCLLH